MPSNVVLAGCGLGAGLWVGGGEVVVVATVGLEGAAASSVGAGQSSRRQASMPPTATARIATTRTYGVRRRAACRARRRRDMRRIIPRRIGRIGSDRTLGGGVRPQDLEHRGVHLDLVQSGRDVLVLHRAVQVDVE